MTTYSTDTTRVTSVWSAHGHTFMSDGEENYESCLVCGALYQLLARADDLTSGDYLAADGSEPDECTHDTSMDHGYDTDTVCNCVACTS